MRDFLPTLPLRSVEITKTEESFKILGTIEFFDLHNAYHNYKCTAHFFIPGPSCSKHP